MSESIRKVSTIFTIDDNEHNKRLKAINSQYKLTQSEIKLAGERLNQFGKNSNDLKYKQEALAKQTENLKNKINLYKDSIGKATTKAEENNKKLQELKSTKQNLQKEYREAVKLYGEESDQVQKLKDQLNKVNEEYTEQKSVVDKNINSVNNYKVKLNESEAQLNKVQTELKKTSTELEKQNSKWISAGESLKKAGENISNFGEKASKVGGTLTKTVTLPIVAAGTAAVTAQVKWESAFAGVKKTVDGTIEQMAALEKGIIGMSKELPTSAEDIAAVAESAGQLGIQTDNILGFTRTIIDLGNATNLVGEVGASQIAKFANITQMSQKDFDRLGSTLVALGNNTATTEADITSMAMRLAGSGHQVKMTEAQILGLAAGLSSVGIEAEMGGSAFSKVMVEMQLAVETGNGSLEEFAKVAGMSTSAFSKAFKEDASGALIAFIKGLSTAEERGTSAIKTLDDMGITEVRMRDALLRAAGAGDLFNKTIEIGTQAWKENTALQNEANQRYATTESQIKITKNEIMNLAREIGVELLPIVKDGLIVVKDLIEKFNNLSPATKENIIKFAGLAAIAGPVIGGTGKIAKGLGTVLKVAGKLSTGLGTAKVATKAIGTASAVAGGTGGVAGLATSLGGVAIAAAPYVLSAGAIAGAGYAIYKGLNQEVIPEVDLFADKISVAATSTTNASNDMVDSIETATTKISESTKNAVGAYVEMDDKAKEHINNLYFNSTTISEQIKTETTTKFNEMANQVVQGYKKQKEDSNAELQGLFENSKTITDIEQQQLLQKNTAFYDRKQSEIQIYENQINAILTKASNDKRALSDEEATTILDIQTRMKENAVKSLSENEVEAQIILQRMKDYDSRVTAEQCAEHIQQLNSSRDTAVATANDEYEQRVAAIIRMRDESHIISADQAQKLIEEAKIQRDGIIEQAENTRLDAIDKIREMNGNLDDEVNTGTGEILTVWDRLKRWWSGWKPEQKIFQYGWSGSGGRSEEQEYALGTNYFSGGLTAINERGYEVVELPRGTKIKNHLQSENIIRDTALQTAKAIFGLNSNEDTNVVVNVYLDGKDIKSQTTKEVIKTINRNNKDYKKSKGGIAFG